MLTRTPVLCAFLLLFSSIALHAQTTKATCTNWKFFNTFTPSGINIWDTVVGSASQSDGSIAGYVRYSNGGTKKYVDPNAAAPGFAYLSWTFLTERNAARVTNGWYRGASQNAHGLLLSGSHFATLDYPGAVETVVTGINKWNSVVGYWGLGDFSQPYDGFKMWANGAVTTIAAPGAMQTSPAAISDTGIVVGSYVPGNVDPFSPFPDHGFVLKSGVYTSVDYPNSFRTFLTDVNSSGVIVGSGGNGGFLYVNGKFKDVVGPNGETTGVDGINDHGYVTGTLSDGRSFIAHCQ